MSKRGHQTQKRRYSFSNININAQDFAYFWVQSKSYSFFSHKWRRHYRLWSWKMVSQIFMHNNDTLCTHSEFRTVLSCQAVCTSLSVHKEERHLTFDTSKHTIYCQSRLFFLCFRVVVAKKEKDYWDMKYLFDWLLPRGKGQKCRNTKGNINSSVCLTFPPHFSIIFVQHGFCQFSSVSCRLTSAQVVCDLRQNLVLFWSGSKTLYLYKTKFNIFSITLLFY